MITLDNLPPSYSSYRLLTVCSNQLIGGGFIVAIGQVLPLLVGRGAKPKIWLQSIIKPGTKDFGLVVDESISLHNAIKVTEDNRILSITAGGIRVLRIYMMGPDAAAIDALDLRPMGLNLHGDKDTLYIGGSRFSGNSMSGGGVLVGLGE